jgi:hypothetical protein
MAAATRAAKRRAPRDDGDDAQPDAKRARMTPRDEVVAPSSKEAFLGELYWTVGRFGEYYADPSLWQSIFLHADENGDFVDWRAQNVSNGAGFVIKSIVFSQVRQIYENWNLLYPNVPYAGGYSADMRHLLRLEMIQDSVTLREGQTFNAWMLGGAGNRPMDSDGTRYVVRRVADSGSDYENLFDDHYNFLGHLDHTRWAVKKYDPTGRLVGQMEIALLRGKYGSRLVQVRSEKDLFSTLVRAHHSERLPAWLTAEQRGAIAFSARLPEHFGVGGKHAVPIWERWW